MVKGVTFGKNDEELVKEIIKYQHKHEIPSFVEAVRRLCKTGIEIDKINNKE